MSDHVLHLLPPSRDGAPAIVAGDREALTALKVQLELALDSGASTTTLYCSDGEPYLLAVVHESDMSGVYTAYRDETNPVRSLREQRPMAELASTTIEQHAAALN